MRPADVMPTIAIVGAVGIPASYGGFETLTENLAIYHHEKSIPCRLVVFCSSLTAERRASQFELAELIYVPLQANGFSSIAYDIASMLIAIKNGASSLLILGVSGAIALPFIRLFSSVKIYTNVDGIEWKRGKWGTLARYYLKWSEQLAVRFSHVVIADNEHVSSYLQQEYGASSETIAYGADHVTRSCVTDHPLLETLGNFALGVCRIEPENNVHEILKAFSQQAQISLVMIGNWTASDYARRLREEYEGVAGLQLLDSIYDAGILRGFREKAMLYIHGHSAGGTNPSLVEAMYCSLPVLAFDCSFNHSTTAGLASYFRSADELLHLVLSCKSNELAQNARAMKAVAEERYIWNIVAEQYFSLMLDAPQGKSGYVGDTIQTKATRAQVVLCCRTGVN